MNVKMKRVKDLVIRYDESCRRCPKCNSLPRIVEYGFAVADGILSRGKMVSRDRRVYYHCDCGMCTTEWYRHDRDCRGVVVRDAADKAREAYMKRKWAKSFARKYVKPAARTRQTEKEMV